MFLHSGCPEQDDPTKAAGGPFCHACPEPIDYFESKAQLRAALMDFEDQSCKYTNCDVVERYGPINEWNVSGVHEFNQLFNGLNRFNEDISGWDTSNVGAMVQTFQYARQFNQVMYIHILIMFLTRVLVRIAHHHFSHLTMQDINAWDTSGVFVMILTFMNCASFDQGRIPAYQCLSSS